MPGVSNRCPVIGPEATFFDSRPGCAPKAQVASLAGSPKFHEYLISWNGSVVRVDVLALASKNTPSGATPLIWLGVKDKLIGEAGDGAKLALTERAADIVTAQVGVVPLQAPPQVVKTLPAVGVAVRIILLSAMKVALQLVPQAMPEGEELIVPAPLVVVVNK